MDEALGDYEVVIDPSLSKIPRIDGRWLGNMGKRAWELYIGFLYGHPIWTRSDRFTIEEDFKQLVELWEDGHWNHYDNDAADAAIDAIRKLVVQHSEELSRPFNVLKEMDSCDFDRNDPAELLMDFMVYGKSGLVFGKWYEACMDGGDEGYIDKGLADRFAKKADAKADGGELLDLMKRCRYHCHENDPCYLDK